MRKIENNYDFHDAGKPAWHLCHPKSVQKL